MELKLYQYQIIPGANILLIVPYGIETTYEYGMFRLAIQLLIVPYGIETQSCSKICVSLVTFNRTLWN